MFLTGDLCAYSGYPICIYNVVGIVDGDED